MNLNIITYCIYLPVIIFITVRIGWICYKNGELFLKNLFKDKAIVKSINNLLLLGYYLTNIGYAIITISYWETIHNVVEVISSLTFTLGKIILILAALHYNNIFLLQLTHKHKFLKQ
ncbi:hypothetical protein [Mesoflavibacter zeaxanthinifaciens]|uniref:hypothetical protein n=1 Tax=Mesoflavibacter zeaxanthinifaciens TaxID=393060 RepID=UPI0004843DA0|nr:hypothetical protein [Mesoflavibacter zeaxanthinifaciens]